MHGNVCTYDHNMDAISAKNWLRSTFRVRCHAVHDALQWLKLHNPKYYGQIEISPERLDNLPQDDVLVEITLDDDEGTCVFPA